MLFWLGKAFWKCAKSRVDKRCHPLKELKGSEDDSIVIRSEST